MNRLSLARLAELVGMRPRTVRSYIERGLLPGPATAGRYASYGPHHLARLKAIRVLREIDGLSLEETRRRLVALDEAEVERIASRLDDWRERPEASLAVDLAKVRDAGAPAGTEADRGRPASGEPPRLASFRLDEEPGPASAAPVARPTSLSARERESPPRASRDPGITPEDRVPRRSRAEPMMRIEVTPDIDLVVRGVRDDHQLRRLERIADYVRNALLGPGDE